MNFYYLTSGQLMLALMRGFHCCEPKQRQPSCVALMVTMTTYDVYFDVKEEDESKEEDETKEGEDTSDKVGLHLGIIIFRFEFSHQLW